MVNLGQGLRYPRAATKGWKNKPAKDVAAHSGAGMTEAITMGAGWAMTTCRI